MKFLIDCLHPAHVHFFRHFIKNMQKKGHSFILLSRDKDCTLELLDKYGLSNICLSKQKQGKYNLVLELIKRLYRTIKIIKKEKPDLLMGIMGAVIAPAGKLTKTPSYIFYGTEHAKLTNYYVYKTATKFITPDCYGAQVPNNIHLAYKGYPEMAYLHPNMFKPDINKIGNLKPKEYIFLRLVSWQASHDIRDKGIIDAGILIKELEKYGRVIISSEAELPPEYKKYKYDLPIENIHHVLAFAKFVIGESHTIASESACLGTPAITISQNRRGFTNKQEEKGMVFNCSNQDEAIEALKVFAKIKDWDERYKDLMKDSIDITKFMIEVVENG